LIPLVAVVVLMGFAFANQLPEVITSLRELINSTAFIPDSIKNFDILATLQDNAGYVVDSTKTAILIIGSIVTIIVSAFYLIYDQASLTETFLGLAPESRRAVIRDFFADIAEVIGNYIRGNLIISAISAIITFIALTILGVPFALPLAIFTGLMGLLPYIGPLIALIPAFILGLAQSPLTGLLVFIIYIVYQQIENTFIVPLVYKKALNLSPALVFLSVVIGGGLFGVLGAFLALPVAASIPVIVAHLGKFQKSL
jgi:predicted PurR-regulated permease PerM